MAEIINNAGESTVTLPSVSAPSDTTDKLYNESGVLTFDGVSLEGGGGGGGTSIEDADTNTKVDVEEGADDNTIRMDVGPQTGWSAGGADVFLLRSSGLTIALPTADVAATVGAPISITAGNGYTTGNGGSVGIYGGSDGANAGGFGGAVTITGGVNSSNGTVKTRVVF